MRVVRSGLCSALLTLAASLPVFTGVPPAESPPPAGSDEARARIHALYKMKGKGAEAQAACRAALRDPSGEMRAAAVQMLAQEAGASAVADLAPLTGDPDARVVLAAAAVLIRLGGEATIEPIRRALASEVSSVRAQTVGYIGDKRDDRFLPEMGRLLADPNLDVRRTTAAALLALSHPASFSSFMAATTDADDEVVVTSVRGLMRLGDPRAIPRMAILGASDREHVRAAVAYALPVLGATETQRELLERLLKDPKSGVRAAVVTGLRDAPSPHGLILLQQAAAGEDPRLRQLATTALKFDPDPKADAVLVGLTRNTTENVRASAVMALGSRKSPQALERLAAMTGDPAEGVRAAVANALGDLQTAKALQPLGALLRDPAANVRAIAAESMGRIGGTDALALLERTSTDSDPYVRLQAVKAMGRLDIPKANEALRKAAVDKDLTIRLEAINLLGTRKDVGSIELLRQASQDPAEVVRRAARTALESIAPNPGTPTP